MSQPDTPISVVYFDGIRTQIERDVGYSFEHTISFVYDDSVYWDLWFLTKNGQFTKITCTDIPFITQGAEVIFDNTNRILYVDDSEHPYDEVYLNNGSIKGYLERAVAFV